MSNRMTSIGSWSWLHGSASVKERNEDTDRLTLPLSTIDSTLAALAVLLCHHEIEHAAAGSEQDRSPAGLDESQHRRQQQRLAIRYGNEPADETNASPPSALLETHAS